MDWAGWALFGLVATTALTVVTGANPSTPSPGISPPADRCSTAIPRTRPPSRHRGSVSAVLVLARASSRRDRTQSRSKQAVRRPRRARQPARALCQHRPTTNRHLGTTPKPSATPPSSRQHCLSVTVDAAAGSVAVDMPPEHHNRGLGRRSCGLIPHGPEHAGLGSKGPSLLARGRDLNPRPSG